MKNKRIKIELLAPAKNKEAAIAAINCGADAVYLGYLKFGARSAAGNSIEDIKQIVDYAHIYRAKVYVTLNTILKNEELEQAVELINQLYLIGVDAIIIQDMGLLECELPPIPIIASTQCHNDSLEKIKFLEDTGFKRVILPREFSLDDIKNVSKHTNIELETFVHGALCVSYSGQCYMSYAIGGRSANRGECAQPCRKKYSLKDSNGKFIAKDKYLLSLKDFNLSAQIKDLILAGVTSFKIEGRLKDEAYIKNVVSYYRRKIDSVLSELSLEKSSLGKTTIDFEPNLQKTFNRGYTEYFLNKRNSDIATIDYTKSIGEFIGKVTSVDNISFTLDKNILHNGDGICFFDSNKELLGTNINKVSNKTVFPRSMNGIQPGMKIYRNFDSEFISKLENSKIQRKIEVYLEVKENNSDILFSLKDEEGVSVEIEIKNNFETASNQEKALENIKKQLSKLGDTEFSLYQADIGLTTLPFIPVSELNLIRRNLVEVMQAKRAKSYKREVRNNEIKVAKYPIENLEYNANIYNDKAKLFYQKRGVKNIEPAAELQKNLSGKTIMTTKHCLKYSFGMCSKQNTKVQCVEPLILVDDYSKEYTLNFDCKNCQMHIIF